ncbi:UbiH/UbiF family hydroxylase [Acuticoccus sediminis]|uniref:UbiH/UbiF family hydroxylase n=1 Tax=Acuticoccus sediminis TaxID=2184697 RepID=A0A8B2NT22_9HYPH|nr:FAD-dependent monooxygenase [Acuticoccus sediminis]RAI00604.1 UbiH/UbiF family hydroxylase [Acuticoccus sediminis]
MDSATPAPLSNASLTVDVAVVGGGPAGALAAIVVADAGFKVALVAPDRGRDPRTSALFMPSIELLEEHGVWSDLVEDAAPLHTIRIIDQTGHLPRAPEVAFDAQEIGPHPFGYNITNDALNAALSARLAALGVPRVDALADHIAGTDGPVVTITAGAHTVEAGLVVAADGAESFVREAAGLSVRRWAYRQSAFVTTLSHERPHGGVSVEFHTPAGPFTLVPLKGERSSLVWVARPEEAERWAAMDPGPLAREIEKRCHAFLGHMAIDGPRGVIPMAGHVAPRMGAGRVVLVSEAGHRFPPIGAQGLNLGFRDIATLQTLLRHARPDRDLAGIPERYHIRRRTDVSLRTASVDVLNRSLLTGAFVPSTARAVALSAARGIPPLRRAMMRFGLGA